jgi:hypothetical protein
MSRRVRVVGHLGYIQEMRKLHKIILGGRYEENISDMQAYMGDKRSCHS